MQEPRSVMIVGGGFSGVAVAAHLLKRGNPRLRVTLLEAGERFGRGIAYGTRVGAHLLNTRADRMSLFADEPQHFLQWLNDRGVDASLVHFVERRIYGEYVEDCLRDLCATVPCSFEGALQTNVIDAELSARGFDVTLAGGRRLRTDTLVLATGHPLPADPLATWLEPPVPRYLREPWNADALNAIAPNDRVLLLGTGLTMVDVVLTLASRSHRAPVDAVSRRGLLPHSHAPATELLPRDLLDAMHREVETNNLRRACRAVRKTIAAAERRGLQWHAVIDALRGDTARFWAAMCAADRRRFVERLRPYWDVHRHRLPPASAERIAALRRAGGLAIVAARVLGAASLREGLAVDLQPRGATARRKTYDWIVNCTGASFDKRNSREFERRLIERGLLIADPLALGYLTTPSGAAFGARGPVDGLYLVGPACRPRCWEHTAVPELREQAHALAGRLLDDG